ncbi:MAG: ATP-binding protein, partial [Alphaproteobacteria bacterium]
NLTLGRRNRDLIRELRTALQRAEEANVAKTHFLANTSHELRTPLNAIIGFSELMKDEHMGPLDRKYRQYADDIHESGRHLLSVINDILDLAKIEADRMDVDAERVDLRAVWNTALRMVAPRAERAGVDLMARIDGSLPPLLADERRLTQVAINLLANAIDFTPAGGDVVFRARLAEENDLIVTVSDTGVGMAPEEIPRALAPFEQVETGLARRRGGTGLGLSLSKRIVELLGGTMKVTSAAGIGTTVALHFPRNLVLSEIAPPTDTEPAQSISSGK